MIANFFQSLDQRQVEYLLISGQATVLYGAATFSEDVDLWIKPTEANCGRFLATLSDCRASYYKLTPPFTVEHLQFGHGFHFVLPGDNCTDVYLDIMGSPPRSGLFDDAANTARQMETEWGNVRTIGILPLVELKKTQRLQDYPIISKLALAWFDQPDCAQSNADYLWALQNIFTLPELATFFLEHPAAVTIASEHFGNAMAEFGRLTVTGGEVAEEIESSLGQMFQKRMAGLQQADRLYWRKIIQALKELRSAGALAPEGQLV